MIVTFICQCQKKALVRTRLVLDAFANRIGDNTWQTVITKDGLQMVKKLLARTASKNTAVSCYRFHTRKHSELLWIVGNRQRFNEFGFVPVNRTKRDILKTSWKHDWQYIGAIEIIATLAALFHDIGKSTIGFQKKLIQGSKTGDPYRHEWISLKCLLWLIQGCTNDNECFERFIQIDAWLGKYDVSDLNTYLLSDELEKADLSKIPPLMQWLLWLVVSHHRLPPLKEVFLKDKERHQFQIHPTSRLSFECSLSRVYADFAAKNFWVKNPQAFENNQSLKDFWQFNQCVIVSKKWQSVLKRWAKKALQNQMLQTLSNQNKPIDNAILLYLSRLCLMIADHNYSSLAQNDSRRLLVKSSLPLAANTNNKTRQTKQFLDEHLLGVAAFTAHFAHHLPIISEQLPTLLNHRVLNQNTVIDRFIWQNHAYKIAQSVQNDSDIHGFFGINMASTGTGKTIANARIMYALSNQQEGARFTIALGLRVLTLQTGLNLRKDLQLTSEQLAILVGGGQTHQLLSTDEQKNQQVSDDCVNGIFGSESADELVDGFVDSTIDHYALSKLNIDTLLTNIKTRDLLFSPVVTCTIDHLIGASECRRGGGYIAPMLRLLSSDLILDEVDDFDYHDLPALARLVHLAGMMGSKIVLSSATLPPDLVKGLFESYASGRKLFNQSQNKPVPKVICAWFGEQKNSAIIQQCIDKESFIENHQKFIKKRVTFLQQQPVRHKAQILPVPIVYHQDKKAQFYTQLGQKIIDGAVLLHHSYHVTCQKSGKNISVGLVRIANIKQLVRIAFYLQNALVDLDTYIHVACYHARQPLILRNQLERSLDKILTRKTDEQEIFKHDKIYQAMAKSNAKHHIFMVLATPLAEVGRDHDYDWAIIEPSSMRSIIQLAGRVWRHRPKKQALQNNLLILNHNIRYLQQGGQKPVFTRPGFETQNHKLTKYDMHALIDVNILNQIDARSRIFVDKIENKPQSLIQLEHGLMNRLFNQEKTNYVNAYWRGKGVSNRLHTHLQQISPFRHNPTKEQEWVLIPRQINENDDGFDVYALEDVYKKGIQHANKHNSYIQPMDFEYKNSQIDTWLDGDVYDELLYLQSYFPEKSLSSLAIALSRVTLADASYHDRWYFCPFLGVVAERLSS